MKNTKKPRPISMTALKATLRSAAFNPRTPGPMKIVAQMDNPSYWMLRAAETTLQAEELFQCELDEEDREQLLKMLDQGIQLLALARTKLSS